MSVADSPFDSAWKVAKAPLYHSVNTDTSDPEVADKLFRLRDELMAEGITFDAGGGYPMGGRDWELDWSLKGATPDEVMARMRDAGIPFTTEMRYEEEGDERLSNRPNTDDEGNKNPPHAVGIGESKCPECGGMAMIIRETDGSLTLGCGDCGLLEEYDGPDPDDLTKFYIPSNAAFDEQRAEMARTVDAQIPDVDDNVDLNLNIGGNQGDCCEAFRQRMQEIWIGTPYDDAPDFLMDEGKEAEWYWDFTLMEADCELIIQRWNDTISPIVEADLRDAQLPVSSTMGLGRNPSPEEIESHLVEGLPPHYYIIKDMIEDTLQAIEEYEACQRGGFEGVDFGGDFQASGDVFEDSWSIVKFDADRAMQARTLEEQEEETAPVINLEPPLDSGDDPCCVNAKNKWIEGLREIFGMDESRSLPRIFANTGDIQHAINYQQDPNYDLLSVNQNIIDDYEKMSCDELIEVLRDFAGHMPGIYHKINVTDRRPGNETPEHWLALRILEEYDECVAEMTMGSSDAVDMYRSGDSFEDAWSVAKNINPSAGFPRKRCWLCERVKDSYGAYPDLPWYPPNWNRPCDCSGGL